MRTANRLGSYPDVKIHNATPFLIDVTVRYAACRHDSDQIGPNGVTSFGRGLCVVTGIDAKVTVNESDYTESAYSQYHVIELTKNHFVVTRVEN